MSERNTLINELKSLYQMENGGFTGIRSRYTSYPNKYEITDHILQRTAFLALFFLIGFLMAYIIMKERGRKSY